MPKVTYRQQMRKAKGRTYGPFWYAEWKDAGRVRTRYVGKTFQRIAEDSAQDVAELPGPDLFELRTRESWLLLGYDPQLPPKYEVARKKVFNLLAAKTRPEGIKQEIAAAWQHLQEAVWPGRKRGPTKKGALS